MLRATTFCLTVIAALFSLCLANEYEIFVAPNGNDKWSGLNPKPSSNDGPFKTMTRAQQYIRDLRNKVGKFSTSPIVTFAPGNYYVNKTILFDARDSGESDQIPVIYRSTPGATAKAVVTSCQPILQPLYPVEGSNLIRTIVPLVKSGQLYFNELFVNTERRPRARFPTKQFDFALNQSRTSFVYKDKDVQDWGNMYDANIIMFHSWTASRSYIDHINFANRTVVLSNPANYNLDAFPPQSGKRYYVENVFEALDEPGEWYLNRKTGELSYLPMEGETIDNIQFCYPQLQELVKLVGDLDSDQLVKHIVFQNLGFAHTTWYINRTQFADIQADAWQTTATVFLRDTTNIKFLGCSVEHTGEYAIYFERGCTFGLVDECVVRDMGAGGVRIGQVVFDSKYATSHITVSNSVISHGGNVWLEGVGVLIHKSSHNVVWNNQILHMYYTGVSVGWTWGYTESDAYNNSIAYNYIRDIGMYLLNDMGGIYSLGISNGTTIHHNVIENVHSFIEFAWGIYLDEGSSNVLVYENMVRKTGSASFFQHYGQNNVVFNNVFMNSDADDGDIAYGLLEDHLCYKFYNNKVYQTTKGASLIYSGENGYAYKSIYDFDHNKYFICTDTPIKIWMNRTLITYEQWTAFPWYQDVNSEVIHGGCAEAHTLFDEVIEQRYKLK